MRDRLLVAALVASLVAAGGAFAAPPEDHLLPVDQHSSEKGRDLARKHAAALHALDAGIYDCMPWLDILKNSIGFFKPKHLNGDTRYLSLRIFVEQDPSPQFMALGFQGRASAMFSRYVGEMLRRMTQNNTLLGDARVDGFTVIVGWTKQIVEDGRPFHETIASFTEKAVAADYVAGRVTIGDLARHTVVLGYDGDKPLGQVKLQAWEDTFVKTFQVANYQPAAGVSCPR